MPGHAMYVRFVKVNLYLIYSVLVSSSEILSKENRYNAFACNNYYSLTDM